MSKVHVYSMLALILVSTIISIIFGIVYLVRVAKANAIKAKAKKEQKLVQKRAEEAANRDKKKAEILSYLKEIFGNEKK